MVSLNGPLVISALPDFISQPSQGCCWLVLKCRGPGGSFISPFLVGTTNPEAASQLRIIICQELLHSYVITSDHLKGLLKQIAAPTLQFLLCGCGMGPQNLHFCQILR